MDKENYHCGHCGLYVSDEDGYYGAAERKDGGPQRIYCNQQCCVACEGVNCQLA